ncbi:HipA family kinase [Pseudomonas sp. HY2-MNA-CIBAN-0224]|uniref:HipA family kinase n=1 Tax=Pseudomonas sp. HY2-MNA-CIBAN-0224 TaxID=3140471 RepID=UPI00331EBE02
MTNTTGTGKVSASKSTSSSSSGYQKRLFPVDILTEYPNNQGSADLQLIINGRDGRDYAVKKPSDGRGRVPASELLCYELAYRVTIPTPNYAYINLSNGDTGFGSIWEGGVMKISHITQVMQILQYHIKVNNIRTFLSRLYAFDIFVNNDDRHWGNYLWRQSFDNSFIALAFDFSRACFETGHAGFEAFLPDCNTQKSFTLINLTMNYDRTEAINCLDMLSSISSEEIEDILNNMPSSWMTVKEKRNYIEWWASSARIERIENIKRKI